MKLPLNGRGAHLGERLLFQPLPCGKNQFLLFRGRFLRLRFGSPRTVLVPFCVPRLVSLQPLKEPLFRTVQPGINVLWRLLLQIFHNRELPDILFHTITSLLVNEKIIVRKRVSGNLCDGTKIGIKGNLSVGTCG
jgi:hypothetical protein